MAMARKVIKSNLASLSKKHRRAAKRLPIAVAKAQKRIADEAIALHQKTVKTWKRKPRFYARKTARGFTINTDSDVYFWVDYGTRPHPIEAKRAPFLVFAGPYHAQTKPRVISSYMGGRGKVWIAKKRVKNPGKEARHFTDENVK